jgi:phosphoglycolate phosphatase
MNSLLIFDLDGTLADTRADLSNAVNLTRNYYNLSDLSREEIINYVGEGRTKLIVQAFNDMPGINIEEAADLWSSFYNKILTVETKLYPGVAEGLEELYAKKYHMAVLSNKPGDMCREITAHFDLDKKLVTALGGGDLATTKPEPEGIYEVIARAEKKGFRRNGDNIWMIGDHYTDLKAARNAGVKSIFCNYGFGNRKDQNFDFEVSSFGEIARIVS